MKQTDLSKTIQVKVAELEAAQEAGRSREEIAALYKELKELQFQKVQSDLEQSQTPE